jgi:hypothetical protein
MTAYRVMFIGHGPSNLAEDHVVNTFHFWKAGAAEVGDPLSAAAAVTDFYNGLGTGANLQNSKIGSYLSAWVQRSAELRVYNMADEKPRVPTIVPITLPAVAGAGGLPEEVALTVTLKGNPPDTARRRGRIYVGPLITGAMLDATASIPARPAAIFITDLVKAASRLTTATALALRWSIRSSMPEENYVVINGGYIDNAFDTQRRRGPDPSLRTLFTTLS